ncbi:MAG: antitoxin [Verrucomicrobia bacterium]|nr:antitoxin [Verrucomicrobiota bacterium]MBS0636497.1 antitoxin [Verrucomicrobiota bacterium]
MTANNFNLRGVPSQVMALLKSEAKKCKVSVNSLILNLIEQGIGYSPKPKRVKHHDLDFLIGTWSAKESQEFDEQTKVFEKIDDELWK